MVATRSEPVKGTGLKQAEGLIGQLRLSFRRRTAESEIMRPNRREEMTGLLPIKLVP